MSMGWVRVAEERQLRTRMGVLCEGHRIALFRLPDGIFALDDVCSHEYSLLSEGEIWEADVYCPKHGSRFDIRTGAGTRLKLDARAQRRKE